MYVYECLSHIRRGSATVLMSRRVSHYTSWLILGFFQGDRRADGYRVGRYIYYECGRGDGEECEEEKSCCV